MSGCVDGQNTLPADDLAHADPKIVIIDSIVESRIDSLGLMYRVVSPKLINTFENNQFLYEYPEGLEVQFFNKQEGKNSGIVAGYAFIDGQGVAHLKNGVIIRSQNGDELATSQLVWDQYHAILHTDKLVRLIQTSGDTTYGFGLTADQDFTSFRIKKGFVGKRHFQNDNDVISNDP